MLFSFFLWHNLPGHKQTMSFCGIKTLKETSILVVISFVVFQEFNNNSRRRDLFKNRMSFPALCSKVFRDPRSHFQHKAYFQGKVSGGLKWLGLSAGVTPGFICGVTPGTIYFCDQNFSPCIEKLHAFVYSDFSALTSWLFLGTMPLSCSLKKSNQTNKKPYTNNWKSPCILCSLHYSDSWAFCAFF